MIYRTFYSVISGQNGSFRVLIDYLFSIFCAFVKQTTILLIQFDPLIDGVIPRVDEGRLKFVLHVEFGLFSRVHFMPNLL